MSSIQNSLQPTNVQCFHLVGIAHAPSTLLANIPSLAGKTIKKILFSHDAQSFIEPIDISLDDGGAMLVGHVISIFDTTLSGGGQFRLDFETTFTDPARIWIRANGNEQMQVFIFT